MYAGLGALAAILALTSVAAPMALALLGLAAVFLTGCALYGDDRQALQKFAAINGVAILLLTWGAMERSELVIARSPEQIDVSVNGVRLSASLVGLEGPLDRVSVELSAVDERPVAAPWMSETLPAVGGFGDWLEGGMRGGLERLRVTDADGADLVPALSGLWQPDHQEDAPRLAASADGWLAVRDDDGATALVSSQLAGDRYQVVATMVRPSGQVKVSLAGSEPGTALDIVAAPDRRLFEVVARPADGLPETLVGGPFVYRRTVAGWTQALLRELGRVWLVAVGLVALARLLSVRTSFKPPSLPTVVLPLVVGIVAALIGMAALTLTGLVALVLLDGIPHTVESIAYLFQAQILSYGGMWVQAPLLPEFFSQAYIAATPDGRWFGVLPPGQSLLLAAGLWFGVPWLVSPLATAFAVGLTVVLGRMTYGTVAGVVAGVLLLLSPFVLMLSGDMLAHPAGLLLVVLMMVAVVAAETRATTVGWLLAGLAMGGLILTRPLAAVGMGVPLTILLVRSARGSEPRALALRAMVFVLAAMPGVVYAGYFNAAMTGSPSLPPISLWSDVDRIGFGQDIGTRGGHDLSTALGNTWANLAVLLRHLFGWPSYLTLALAAVPFVLGSTNRWDRMFILCTGGLIAAHWLYWSDGIIYGPRFTFEATAALALLTARGAALLARADGRVPCEKVAVEQQVVTTPVLAQTPQTPAELLQATGARGIPATMPDGSVPSAEQVEEVSAVATVAVAEPAAPAMPPFVPDEPPPPIVLPVPRRLSAAPLVAALVAALLAVNLIGYMPEVVLAYRDYNGVSRANLRAVEAAGLERSVVFVNSEYPDWQSYGEVFLANGPFVDKQVVYARDLGETENWRLMTRYSEWRGWLLRDLQLTEIRR